MSTERAHIRVQFLDGVEVRGTGGEVELFTSGGTRTVTLSGPIGRLIAQALDGGGVTMHDLSRAADQISGTSGIAEAMLALRTLQVARVLRHDLLVDDAHLITATQLTDGTELGIEPTAPDNLEPLASEALLRVNGERFGLEAPEARAELWLEDQAAFQVVATLAVPRSVVEISRITGLDEVCVCAIVGVIESAGFTASGAPDWELHDRLFHCHTRYGYVPRRIGKRPAPDHRDVAEFTWPVHAATVDLAAICPSDRIVATPLERILDGRRSRRTSGGTPLSLEAVASLLNQLTRPAAPGPPFNVYPRPGAIDAFAFLLWAGNVDGLRPGCYAHDLHRRCLVELPGGSVELQGVLRRAAGAMGQRDDLPDAVIGVALDYSALAREYQGIVYRLGLLTAGAIWQTLYLIATDLGLAPCAIGTGESRVTDAILRQAGSNATTIAEFAISSGR